MASDKDFNISILNEEGVIYFGPCQALFVPTLKGDTAIMAFHTPLIMKLTKGTVAIRSEGKNSPITDIKSGVLYVGENEASVLVGI